MIIQFKKGSLNSREWLMFTLFVSVALWSGLYLSNSKFHNFYSRYLGDPVVLISEEPTVFRNDIKAYTVADIVDENGEVLFYGLQFYSVEGEKISDIVAVATSTVAIDEKGEMSVQIIDDQITANGDVYASSYIYEVAVNPEPILSSEIEVGSPCIVAGDKTVYVCDSYPLEIDSTLFNSTTTTAQGNSVFAYGGQVKGFTLTLNKHSLLADATESQKSLRQPRPTQPNKSTNTKPAVVQKHKPEKAQKKTNKPKKKTKPEKDNSSTKTEDSGGPKEPIIFEPTETPPELPPIDGIEPPYELPGIGEDPPPSGDHQPVERTDDNKGRPIVR